MARLAVGAPALTAEGLEAELTLARLQSKLFDAPQREVFLRHFALEEVLGQGAAGIVFRARDAQSGDPCALKTLDRCDEEGRQRLKQEFRALAGLIHPNLVVLHELYMDEPLAFLSMELLQGEDFATYARPGGEVDETRLRTGLAQLATGVRTLHAAGWVHRDLKPSNVMVTRDGRVVIIDLGLATTLRSPSMLASTQASHSGDQRVSGVFGTPGYMAPEQCTLGATIGPPADWFAVGAMLHEVLYGEPPRGGATPFAAQMGRQDRLAASGLEDLAQLCSRLLDPTPQARSEAARELSSFESKAHVRPSRPMDRLVGRHSELAALEDAFEEARRGKAVCILVEGPSGIGKTALLESFCSSLMDDASVLFGRCFEHETVPYKALDGLVDGLVRKLRTSNVDDLRLKNEDVAAALRLFPALCRVPSLRERANLARPLSHDASARIAAVRALKTLLLQSAPPDPGEHTVTGLVIDDLQWGDADSAVLLAEMLAVPPPAGLLLLGSVRSEEANQSQFLAELRALHAQGRTRLEPRSLTLGPLGSDEATQLAHRWLDTDRYRASSSEPDTASFAAWIAAYSAGMPFLIRLLTDRPHAVDTRRTSTSPQVELESRIGALIPSAKQLLLAVSVSGRPVEERTAVKLVRGGHPNQRPDPGDTRTVVRTLVGLRLIRTDSLGNLVAYHDKIRECALSIADPALVRTYHHRLADSLASSPNPVAARVAEHYLKARVESSALKYALLAARDAGDSWAFEQAAHHYRTVLSLVDSSDPQRHEYQVLLAEAYAKAGRGIDAAQAYLDAIPQGPIASRLSLRLAAATQLLRSGRNEEGLELGSAVLMEVGIPVPKGGLATVLSVAWQTVVSAAQRVWFHRTDRGSGGGTSHRLDVLDALFQETFITKPLWGLWLQARFLREALSTGNRVRTSRALGWLSYRQCMTNRPRQGQRSLAQADRLAIRTGDSQGRALLTMLRGGGFMWQGRFRDARECAQQADETLRNQWPGSYWEQNLNMMHWSIAALAAGPLSMFRELVPERLREARLRQDGFAGKVLVMPAAVGHLIEDRPDLAIETLQKELEERPHEVSFAHCTAAIFMPAALRYLGDGQAAHRSVEHNWAVIRKTMFYWSPMVRAPLQLQRGLSAFAAHDETGDPRLLQLARRQFRASLRTGGKGAYGRSHALAAQGLLAFRSGARDSAIELVRRALACCEQQQADFFATVISSRLGEFLGGERGIALTAEARGRLQSEGVKCPERFVDYLIGRLNPRPRLASSTQAGRAAVPVTRSKAGQRRRGVER